MLPRGLLLTFDAEGVGLAKDFDEPAPEWAGGSAAPSVQDRSRATYAAAALVGGLQLALHVPSERIVNVISSLAEQLGLSCVVEGIETDEQLLALPPGVLGQGYLLGRPQSAAALDRLLGDVHGSPPDGPWPWILDTRGDG